MFDDEPQTASGRDNTLRELEREDLSPHSLEELSERVDRLLAEVERAKNTIKNKQKSAEAAASIFKS